MANEQVISDIDLASSLSQMAENTTAAELVRRQGQSKKVKVLSERKLMAWILALLNQHLASKQDSFSDQEKEELLRRTQEELARRIQREQAAEGERTRIQAELAQVMEQISANQGDQTGLDEALRALKARLEEVENLNSDLQQDAYELQDQLQEKLNLLSSTIAEKDHLRDAVRNQMLRSNALVEGVLGLDAQYYAGRHQEHNPVADDASNDEGFYHDFDVGALVIKTLSVDLEKLRSITGKLGDASGDQRSLEQDLDLLTQVKAGNLHAMDVAAPVSGLIEALAGARAEAEALDETIAQATGGQPHLISALPDADGDAAEVIAGATAVARELATELARNRQRISALQNLAEEADNARNDTEIELELVRDEHRRLLDALAAKAPAHVAAVFTDDDVTSEVRIAAVEQFSAISPAETAAHAAELSRLQAQLDHAQTVSKQVEAERKQQAEAERKQAEAERKKTDEERAQFQVERKQAQAGAAELAELRKQLDHAESERKKSLAERKQAQDERKQVQAELAQVQADLRKREAALQAKQFEMDSALASQRLAIEATTAAHQRAIARAVVDAARGDEQLADTAADLALGLDAAQPLEHGYAEQVSEAVAELTNRKRDLERELVQARTTADHLRAQAGDHESAAEQQRVEGARLTREAALHQEAAATAAEQAATAVARVEHMRRELDQALAQVRIAQEDSDAARADATEASAKTRALELRHADRIRTDRVLAGELLEVAKQDGQLVGVSSDLSVALDDDATDDLHHQLGKTVSALAQRQQSLTADYSRLGRDSERLRTEVSEARKTLAETQRVVALAIIQAGKDDADLAQSVSQLEWAIEQMRPGEPMPSDLLQILNQALSHLANRKHSLQAERDEMALNGKEIISALTSTRDVREVELRDLREAYEDNCSRLATIESRAAAAESANRHLAESLSKAALSLPAEAEDVRIDLELALSQLPAEGEEDIDVPADVSQQIAAYGARVATALADRHLATSAALTRAEADHVRLKQELADKASATGRHTSELAGVRKELTAARSLHTATEAHAATLRSELNRVQQAAETAAKSVAAARADLDQASERQLAQADELALRTAEIEGFRVRIANLDKQLNHAQAEVAEFHARGGASAEGLREDLLLSRKELAVERESTKARDAELVELREKSEAAEARLKRLREEFNKRVEERDLLIQQKERELDDIADRRADHTGLEAQVQTLTQQLSQAHRTISDLEAQSGIAAGATGRHSNVGAELKRAQADRDLLREQKRTMEADLAESTSRVDELNTQCDQLRKEMLTIREQVEKTLHEERTKSTGLRDENGRLKADNAGLQQRIRKLSGV